MVQEVLSMWVIYDHPRDYPEKYVVRRHVVEYPGTYRPTEDYSLHDTLNDARKAIPHWTVRLERHPQDDVVILETWL
jgi:hypothetical protein